MQLSRREYVEPRGRFGSLPHRLWSDGARARRIGQLRLCFFPFLVSTLSRAVLLYLEFTAGFPTRRLVRRAGRHAALGGQDKVSLCLAHF